MAFVSRRKGKLVAWPMNECKNEGEVIIEEVPMEVEAKAAVLKVSPTVVCVATPHNPPDDMIRWRGVPLRRKRDDETSMYTGSGIIIECEEGGDGRYRSNIIMPASLFKRSNGLQPHQIQVNVRMCDGHLYKGQVLACDFHYNLAVICIQSDSPLQTAKLGGLDDVLPIDHIEHLQSCGRKQYQHHSRSTSIKILPGTKVVTLWRPWKPPYHIQAAITVLCADVSFPTLPCRELFRLRKSTYKGNHGGSLVSYSGEVLGIMFHDSHFLPSNLISRWWNHYKCHRGFRRPWLGVDIVNLCESHLNFMEKFVRKFPDVAIGVLVTKVEADSPAYCSRIQRGDVIVKCNGKEVHSKLEFFEQMWDYVGKPVELNVLRMTDGDQSYPGVTIGETSVDKFYKWWLPPLVTTKTTEMGFNSNISD